MTTLNKTFLAAALLSALGTACAADVAIYGRVDTGLIFNHNAGDSETAGNTLSLNSGTHTATRWGLRGNEDLTADTKVIFQLENRFESDTGAFKEGGRMFGGQVWVGLRNTALGELTMGRMAGVSSGSGPYDLQYYMDAFGGGTNGTGNAPVKSSRYDNMVTWRTPMWAGFQATFQYSMENDGSNEGRENTSDVNRFYAAGLRYNNGPLNLVGIYEGLTWGHKESTKDTGATTSKKAVTLGGSYKFEPVTVYFQTQYYNGVNSLDGFSAKYVAAVKNADGSEKTPATPAGSIKGYGIYAGTQFWLSGLSSWQSMVYWKDYKLERAGDSFDGSSIGVATKYIYRPSKTVDMYVGAGFSQWDRVKKDKIYTDKNVNVFSGVTKYF